MNTVDICNLALNMVGMSSIVSINEDNNNGRLCKSLFPACRDRVLRDHSWSFATKKFSLARNNLESLDPDLPFVCALPGDCIAVRYLLFDMPYRAWGRNIMVRNLPATLIYTSRIEDSTLFDVSFTEALQYMLAAELAMSNTLNGQLVQMFRQEYERRLAVARSIDSSENRFAYKREKHSSRWIASRGAGSSLNAVENSVGTSLKWVEGTEGKQV